MAMIAGGDSSKSQVERSWELLAYLRQYFSVPFATEQYPSDDIAALIGIISELYGGYFRSWCEEQTDAVAEIVWALQVFAQRREAGEL